MRAASSKLRIKKGQTDGRTDGRETVTLRLPLNAASVISNIMLLNLKI